MALNAPGGPDSPRKPQRSTVAISSAQPVGEQMA
jgi:hypothetical protein